MAAGAGGRSCWVDHPWGGGSTGGRVSSQTDLVPGLVFGSLAENVFQVLWFPAQDMEVMGDLSRLQHLLSTLLNLAHRQVVTDSSLCVCWGAHSWVCNHRYVCAAQVCAYLWRGTAGVVLCNCVSG